MLKRNLLLLSLLIVVLAGCAPAGTSTAPPVTVTEPAVAAPPTETLTAPQEAPTLADAATQVAEATALPVATSRGPDLHATDPSTVSLASGGLQFVEFFRFT